MAGCRSASDARTPRARRYSAGPRFHRQNCRELGGRRAFQRAGKFHSRTSYRFPQLPAICGGGPAIGSDLPERRRRKRRITGVRRTIHGERPGLVTRDSAFPACATRNAGGNSRRVLLVDPAGRVARERRRLLSRAQKFGSRCRHGRAGAAHRGRKSP